MIKATLQGVLATLMFGLILLAAACGDAGTRLPKVLREGQTARFTVKFSAPAGENDMLRIDTSGGTAFGHIYGSGQDFIIEGYSPDDYGVYEIPLEKGAGKITLTIKATDDDVYETDETAVLSLSGAAEGIIRFVIRDNDTKLVKNLKTDYAAAADGKTDDTEKLQRAVDDTIAAGGGVVFIPKGTYIITSVLLSQGVTVCGEEGTVIKRPPEQGKWCRTFYCNYSGEGDSAPIVIRDMTINGNSSAQGSYKNYELEQAHLVFFVGNEQSSATQNGRVRGAAENLTLVNGVGDGVSVYTNAEIGVYNITATDVFRGGLVITGGNTTVRASTVTTKAGPMGDPGGIDIEVDGRGYEYRMDIDVRICRFRAEDGDFDVMLPEESSGVFFDCYSGKPYNNFGGDPTVKELTFNRCVFTMGLSNRGHGDMYAPDQFYLPGIITFNDCIFYASMAIREEDGRNPSVDFVAPVSRINWFFGKNAEGTLVFQNCRFEVVRESIEPGYKTCAVFFDNSFGKKNRLVLRDCEISADYDFGLKIKSKAYLEIYNLINHAKVPEELDPDCIVKRN